MQFDSPSLKVACNNNSHLIIKTSASQFVNNVMPIFPVHINHSNKLSVSELESIIQSSIHLDLCIRKKVEPNLIYALHMEQQKPVFFLPQQKPVVSQVGVAQRFSLQAD